MKTEWRKVISFISKIPGLTGNLEVDALILFETGEFLTVGMWTVPGEFLEAATMCSHPISRLPGVRCLLLWDVPERWQSWHPFPLHCCSSMQPHTQEASHVPPDFINTESEREWVVFVSPCRGGVIERNQSFLGESEIPKALGTQQTKNHP